MPETAKTGRHVLPKEQAEKFVKHLHATVHDVNCQWCGKSQWIPSDHYIVPWILTPGGEVTLDNVPLIPLLLNTCGNCGYTMFFNAVVADVWKQGEIDVAKPE